MIICHSLIRLIRERHPGRPIDLVGRPPGIDIGPFMPEVRPTYTEPGGAGRMAFGARRRLAERLAAEDYGTAYVISRSWKAGLTPWMAAIPERIGWFGEARLGLINRPRFGDKAFVRQVDQICSIALEPGEMRPVEWPEPKLVVPAEMMASWRSHETWAGASRPVLAVAPASAENDKNWPLERYIELARRFAHRGWLVVAVGRRSESAMTEAIAQACGSEGVSHARDSISDLACVLNAADLFVGNDSGPNHLAAALGKSALGVFGPTFEPPINRNALLLAPASKALWQPRDWPSVDRVEATLNAALERRAA